jgi:hypothetical protein
MITLSSNVTVEQAPDPPLWIVSARPDLTPALLLDAIVSLNGVLVHVVSVQCQLGVPDPEAFGVVVEPATWQTIAVRCLICGWAGRGRDLIAQACPYCDGRVAEKGSSEYDGVEP